jgi:outer membrane receptor protein involved in Fe transport
MMDEGEGEKVEVSSVINDLTMKSDFQYFANPKSSLNFGLHYIHHTYQPSEMIIDGDEYFYILVGKRKADEGGIYLSQEWKASERFSSEFGFRYSLFLVSGQKDIFDLSKMDEIPHEFFNIQFHQNENKMYGGFEPRLSINYLLNSTNSLKFGYARNYQNVHLLSNSTSGTPLNVWHPSSSTIKPQRADQFSIGYFRHLVEKQMEISCEFYYKDMKNQLDFKDGADIFLSSLFESEVARGRGWAYGAELFLKKRQGRFQGWIGYTLSRSKRQFAEINNGKAYSAGNDRPHDFAIVCLYQIHERLTFSANWVYHTGSPVTVPYGKYQIDGQVYTAYTSRNAYRMPAYHRLDIGVTYKTKKHGIVNFTLYNAYGRRNAYAILIRENEWNPNNIEAVKLSLFSFIPSISYNFTF